ncbi:MAG: hypothetical protein HY587_01745 [Candidatus Omnitrophica bacterium]|nr:hypothetical protein [Candidatus Omnitrophota bacterium]
MFRMALQLILVISLFFNTSLATAKEQSKEQSEEEKREQLRKMIEEKKTDLNGTSWDIEIKSNSGKGVLEGADVLVFQDGKFASKKASKKGYSATNYTITPSETAPSVWETMQTSADDGVSFWRGEWLKDSMTGVINRQTDEGTEDYYFKSSAKAKISPTSEGETEKSQDVSESDASKSKTLVSASKSDKETSAATGSKLF